MPTLGWLSILLFLTLGGYAWGASGMLPLIFRDLIGKVLFDAIPDVVGAHPLARLRKPFTITGRVMAWITFGSVLIAAFAMFVIVLMIAVTPLLIIGRFRRHPGGPPPRFTPAGVAAVLRRFFTRVRRDSREEEEPVRLRRSARYATS
jgi:hypothetical protein